MKTLEQTQPISPTEEKIRILRLKEFVPLNLDLAYYADKLNRTPGAISQALNGHRNTKTLLARINRHNNWLENKYAHKSVKKNQVIIENGN